MPSSIMSTATGHVVDPGRVEAINVLGPTIQFLTAPEEANAPCIMRGTIPAGVSIPLHSHADPETFVMISGAVEGLVYTDEGHEWIRIGPGDIFHVPGNAKHGWRNHGRVPAVMLLISTSKIGRFFRELGKPDVPDAPPAAPSAQEIQRFQETSRRYGYWNATPEENARIGITLPSSGSQVS
jgi:quercetin dioxygenase-like cupin family protein